MRVIAVSDLYIGRHIQISERAQEEYFSANWLQPSDLQSKTCLGRLEIHWGPLSRIQEN